MDAKGKAWSSKVSIQRPRQQQIPNHRPCRLEGYMQLAESRPQRHDVPRTSRRLAENGRYYKKGGAKEKSQRNHRLKDLRKFNKALMLTTIEITNLSRSSCIAYQMVIHIFAVSESVRLKETHGKDR